MQFFDRFLEPDDNEDTSTITQHEIADVVDITSAQKVSWFKTSQQSSLQKNR